MRVLVIGGTRFIGVYLTKQLVEQGHEVTLLNRGNHPAPVGGIETIVCDRTNPEALKQALSDKSFDAIFDNNGRELAHTKPLADLFKGKLKHFIYVSSAGVYAKSDQMPHVEGDPVDPNSRHKGKFHTEDYLREQGVPFTAIRPVYIYGPQNYNPLEKWFFDRLVRDRVIPIPGSGMALTHLGHCQDLAAAMVSVLGNDKAVGEIYNVSGEKAVTFDGLARGCAIAIGRDPDTIEIVHYDPKDFDFGKQKAFPMRVQHFFTDISKAKADLDWQSRFSLIHGLKDSFENDYIASSQQKADVDFSLDDQILSQVAT
ncbi:NAD-dependent epimerase/dehydratase family protein [cf. Phormidesmis sp. LEGE 11477]|uniref:NAD-dependent epimerase/dehydratase family protein n=1 Tax=cf. Phormidesmis sp. LEGE 11477 TaxID=1828680 RepID=UPI00187F91E3|nr:NAD-dependent epimerase/dehydratase family protein [cf. Phormidesmis sp. LEGE 11477]MBE9063081.1 NAD-dependent epimerase/dehydratase family protein [cf. Phormidesmis sp. LEGE 11477]